MHVHLQVHTYKVLTVQAASQQPEPPQNSPFCRSASDGHCILPKLTTPAASSEAFNFFKELKVGTGTTVATTPGLATPQGMGASTFALETLPPVKASAFASVATLEPEAPSPLATGWNSALADGNLVSTVERVQKKQHVISRRIRYTHGHFSPSLGTMFALHQSCSSLECDQHCLGKTTCCTCNESKQQLSEGKQNAFVWLKAMVMHSQDAVCKACMNQKLTGGRDLVQLRGILDGNGMFMPSRAVTTAPAPSPFDAAVDRALSATAGSEWGVVHRITRSFSADVDLQARRPAPAAAAAARGGCSTGSLGSPAAAAGARTCCPPAGMWRPCIALLFSAVCCVA